MEYSLEVTKIIEGALKLDKAKVSNYTSLLCDKLVSDGDIKTSKRIKKLLDSHITSEMHAMDLNSVYKTPIDPESRLSIADVVYPTEIDDKIVLNEDNKNKIDKFILSYKKHDLLVASGLDISNTLLFYGPPGCGKTRLANYLSQELNLPLVIARLDSIISSYLGNTSKNIRFLFEYVQRTPCILFLDEFDALAKVRDDSQELGELKRVVNSLLQNIDSLNRESILIAATNHDHLLDPAVWRRFYYKLHINKPDFNSRKSLIKLFLGDINLEDQDIQLAAYIMSDLTGAEIEDICKNALRDSILNDVELTLQLIAESYFEFVSILDNFNTDKFNRPLNQKEYNRIRSIFLRKKDDKIFSYANIGRILGLSKTYVGQLIRESSEGGLDE